MSVLIRDNFLEMPTIIHKWAINQEYYNAKEFTQMNGEHTDWPGKRTKHVVELDETYANVVLSRIAMLAGNYFNVSDVSIRSYFQMSTAKDGDSWVHQDNNINVAAVLYLTPNAPSNSGTTLYDCNDEQKWTSYMSNQEGYNKLKTINSKEDRELYESLFTPRDVVGNVFNRLVMYKGTEFHKSNNYFGDSPENARLIQVFFITGKQ